MWKQNTLTQLYGKADSIFHLGFSVILSLIFLHSLQRNGKKTHFIYLKCRKTSECKYRLRFVKCLKLSTKGFSIRELYFCCILMLYIYCKSHRIDVSKDLTSAAHSRWFQFRWVAWWNFSWQLFYYYLYGNSCGKPKIWRWIVHTKHSNEKLHDWKEDRWMRKHAWLNRVKAFLTFFSHFSLTPSQFGCRRRLQENGIRILILCFVSILFVSPHHFVCPAMTTDVSDNDRKSTRNSNIFKRGFSSVYFCHILFYDYTIELIKKNP